VCWRSANGTYANTRHSTLSGSTPKEATRDGENELELEGVHTGSGEEAEAEHKQEEEGPDEDEVVAGSDGVYGRRTGGT
jgi:hypothetical protein